MTEINLNEAALEAAEKELLNTGPIYGDNDSAARIIRAYLSADPDRAASFQSRVHDWIVACFGAAIGTDRIERNHRFLEEALELVQANGCTQSEAHQLVDYVYGRPVGETHQEVGGVMNTLAALCTASGVDLLQAAEDELSRVWTKVEKIRAKQAAKPKYGPLPGSSEPDSDRAARDAVVEAAKDYVAETTDIGLRRDRYYALHAAVAALPKETPHD